LYSECLTKEALEGFGDFKIGGQIINTVKYADELVLLAKEEKVLQDMTDKLTEIGRCYGMEMHVKKSNRNFKTTIPGKNYDKPKTTRECGIF
jgi:ABC-type enterochelin transport system substrate-binding protein